MPLPSRLSPPSLILMEQMERRRSRVSYSSRQHDHAACSWPVHDGNRDPDLVCLPSGKTSSAGSAPPARAGYASTEWYVRNWRPFPGRRMRQEMHVPYWRARQARRQFSPARRMARAAPNQPRELYTVWASPCACRQGRGADRRHQGARSASRAPGLCAAPVRGGGAGRWALFPAHSR